MSLKVVSHYDLSVLRWVSKFFWKTGLEIDISRQWTIGPPVLEIWWSCQTAGGIFGRLGPQDHPNFEPWIGGWVGVVSSNHFCVDFWGII